MTIDNNDLLARADNFVSRHPHTGPWPNQLVRDLAAALRATKDLEITTSWTLHDFLDALLIAKRNDDVMSVVDAMLAVHVEIEASRSDD